MDGVMSLLLHFKETTQQTNKDAKNHCNVTVFIKAGAPSDVVQRQNLDCIEVTVVYAY